MIEISSCVNSLVIWPPHTKLNQQNHTKPYHISNLYLHLSITAISIHNATQLSCHFRKIATVSHFRLVWLLLNYLFPILLKILPIVSILIAISMNSRCVQKFFFLLYGEHLLHLFLKSSMFTLVWQKFCYLFWPDTRETTVTITEAHPAFVDTVSVRVALPLTLALFPILICNYDSAVFQSAQQYYTY